MKAIKNYTAYIDQELINKILDAHRDKFFESFIPKKIKTELENLKDEYLPNLKCSDETKIFLDKFLTDVKNFNETGIGSVYAENFNN